MTKDKDYLRNPMDPRDRGYAWCILFVCLLTLTLGMFGMASSGVFFVEIRQDLQISSKQTSWISVLQLATVGVVGFLLGPITKRYGERAIAISGSVITSFSLVLVSFAGDRLWVIYFLFGGILGIGMGFQQMGAFSLCQAYFVKHRSLAVGVVSAGTGLGSMIWGPLSVWLIEGQGWRSALVTLGGIQLQGVLLGALMRPIAPPTTRPQQYTASQDNGSKYEEDVSAVVTSGIEEAVMQKVESLEEDPTSTLQGARPDPGYQGTRPILQGAPPDPRYRGSCLQRAGSRYLADPVYLLFILGLLFMHIGNLAPYIFLVNFGISVGATKQLAATLLTVQGISTMIFRITLSPLLDIKQISGIKVYFIGAATSGVGMLTLLFSFTTNLNLLYLYTAIFGIGTATYGILQFTTITDLYGDDDVPIFAGHILLCAGAAAVIALPLGGFLLDLTGRPSAPFQALGGLQTLGSIFLTLSVFLRKIIAKKKQQATLIID